jgi:peroxidase
LVVVVAAALSASTASAQLSSTFYDTSCPSAMSTISSGVNSAVAQQARVGASLLRLHFHDCFVQASLAVSDASIYLLIYKHDFLSS